jgi:hypothetical protein
MTTVVEATPDGTRRRRQLRHHDQPNCTDKLRFDPMQAFVPVSMFDRARSCLRIYRCR